MQGRHDIIELACVKAGCHFDSVFKLMARPILLAKLEGKKRQVGKWDLSGGVGLR